MNYTTIENVENFLQTTFDTQSDVTISYVEQLIDSTSSEIDSITGISFSKQVVTDEVHDLPVETKSILPRNFPVISVENVEYRSNADEWNPEWTTMENFRCEFDVIHFSRPVVGKQALRISYTHGFEEVPAEVEHLATLMVIRRLISEDDARNGHINQLTVGPLRFTNNLSAARLQTLDQSIEVQLRRVGKYKAIFK